MESMPYSAWFGHGDTKEDVKIEMQHHGVPKRIFLDGHMAALVYEDKIVCTGFDGQDHTQYFYFDVETDIPFD